MRAAYSQLGLFHRIYEEMALGMHLPTQYLRRSRIAPMSFGKAEALPYRIAPVGGAAAGRIQLCYGSRRVLSNRCTNRTYGRKPA